MRTHRALRCGGSGRDRAIRCPSASVASLRQRRRRSQRSRPRTPRRIGANGVTTRAKTPVNIVEHDGVDFELLLLTEAVGLRSLHYGFWEEPPSNEDLSFERLREAQARFTERLLAMIPPDVKSVLDVGSGVGDNSAAMLRRGLEVTALSPDKNHGKFYERLEAEGVEFHNVKFEDFPFGRSYDLVLMS